MKTSKKKYIIPGMALALALVGMPVVSYAAEVKSGANLDSCEDGQEERQTAQNEITGTMSSGEETALAEERESGVTWRMDGDILVITGEGDVAWEEKIELNKEMSEAEQVRFENCKITGMMDSFFKDMKNIKSIDLSGLDTSEVTSMRCMFSGCSSLTSLDLSGLNTSQVTDMDSMFYGCSGLTNLNVSGLATSSVESMDSMFSGCSSLKNLDVSGFDTSLVMYMGYMFEECGSLVNLDVSSFHTARVTSMHSMFYGCSSLKSLDVGGFDTARVEHIGQMFDGCNNLGSLDVSGFHTAGVWDMAYMFRGCSNLTALDVSGFNTARVRDTRGMFDGCSSLTALNVSGIDTAQVVYMSDMFSGCSSLDSLDVSGFDTAGVIDMGNMFSGCRCLTSLDLSSFDASDVTEDPDNYRYGMRNMLSGCDNLTVIKAFQAVPSNIICSLPGIFADEDGNRTNLITAEFAGKVLKKDATDAPKPVEPAPGESQVGDLTYRDGKYYFYENGVMAVWREAYVNGAWRWFDGDGTMAVSKDVYQASSGGKWVRYNEKGEMVKGEDYWYGGYYYFEPFTGTMVKGAVTLEDGRKVFYDTVSGQMLKGSHRIGGKDYYFDEADGHLVSGQETKFWVTADGQDFWYEDWQRQGWIPTDDNYRGKEIYDPASDAWYWLDNIQRGAKAVSKDVYQESYSAYPDREDGTGKWVRYDENGHMVKGWDTTEAGTYYFEPITGAMAKGQVTIDEVSYYFDPITGIKQD